MVNFGRIPLGVIDRIYLCQWGRSSFLLGVVLGYGLILLLFDGGLPTLLVNSEGRRFVGINDSLGYLVLVLLYLFHLILRLLLCGPLVQPLPFLSSTLAFLLKKCYTSIRSYVT